MSEARIHVDAVMADIERDVRERLRRHLLKTGGAVDYQDQEIFDTVHALLARVVDRREPSPTLLAELIDGDVDWRLQTHLKLTTHRPAAAGRLILFAKKKLLLPLTRWLFEYSQENFRRQDHLNRILFACIEELALENARLRRSIDSGSAGQPAR
jgi:acyl transferase domain-containing protein